MDSLLENYKGGMTSILYWKYMHLSGTNVHPLGNTHAQSTCFLDKLQVMCA